MSSPLPFTAPSKTSGKVILLATVVAVEGGADKVQVLIAAIRKRAESDEEPKTLTYRTTRGIDGLEDTFTIFEEYLLPNGIHEHLGPAFKALGDSGLVKSLDIKYFNEFTA